MKSFIRRSKKFLSLLLVAVMVLAQIAVSPAYSVDAASNLQLTEASGWLESAYVEWSPVSGAKGYAVFVKKASASDSSYVQLDKELIRNYGSYWRADAVGLAAGEYTLLVAAVLSNGSTVGAKTTALTVKAHDRSGYGWVNGTSSGAYNEDGTLKSNAKVVYITESNKNDLMTELYAKTLKAMTNPLCIRIIGNISDPSNLEGGDVLIDNSNNSVGITIEGIGEDATANGWGIRLKNASNVEVRNIGVMNVNSSEGDNIGLQQNDDHIWVHNCDLFYGDAGSDADQAKGDGALDTKKSHYVTHSYNHFWDTGKSNLQGANKSDTSNYITYHHNWYDHSDSRHPRVRVATVHVYNNYYDGVAKYGIGSTTDSDIFAEGNYFRNCKYPMMISNQGTDALGEGTFSGEVGGIIKAYNNYIVGASSFISYQDNNSSFDAYVASSRNEKVPSSVKALSGGATYNNFDTSSSMYSYTAQNPQDAKATVEKYAGRINGGDFDWTFTAADDTSYAVNSALKSALKSYKTTLQSVGGYAGSVSVPGVSGSTDVPGAPEKETEVETEAPTQAPTEKPAETEAPTQKPAETEAPTQAPSVNAASYVHNFADGKNSDFFSITGNLSTSKGTVSYNGLTIKQCLKMESSTTVKFTVESDANLILVFNANNSSNVKVDGKKYSLVNGVLDMDIKAGSHTITKADTANLYYISVAVEGASVETEAPTEKETEAPVETQAPTEAPTEAPTQKPVETEAPTEAPTQAPAEEVNYVHNFADGKNSNFFSITGNLSTSKGTVSYNGLTIKQCLKIESSTNIKFTVESDANLILVFNAGNSKNIKVDGKSYSLVNGVLDMDIKAGSHTITKADTANLFYIAVTTSGNAGSVDKETEAPTQAPEVETEAPTEKPTETPTQRPTETEKETEAPVVSGSFTFAAVGGGNESIYAELKGFSASSVQKVSYTGAMSGSLSSTDLKYLVRDVDGVTRIDIPGLKAGKYTLTVVASGKQASASNVVVEAYDRSGYAHFNYTAGVGAYNDDGTLKSNAIVLYVTDSNKNTVSVTSKDGTTVTGIGNILNSSGKDIGTGVTSKGGKPNTNQNIIEKLAKDGTPLVVRIIGSVKAPAGVTAYDSVDFGGSEGDNGYMARMQAGKDITIEGIGKGAEMNGWGIHFMATSGSPEFGKSFEVRNINFRNVPEDCIGMEGVQVGSTLTASVERCWIHHCSFYAPKISNPAESDKDGGDGACDFKRGQYFTNSYCYYEGYHKTNLVGASDSNLQYNITYHHNYWKNCESRGPLLRQANVHMYNNYFDGQTSYCMNPRANGYIFSEYNVFENSKDPMSIKSGAIKSYNDTFINCRGDMDGTIVSSKTEKVSSSNKYASFELSSSLSYVPSGDYLLHTSNLTTLIPQLAGAMK